MAAVAPQLPAPDPDLVQYCSDPGVPETVENVEQATDVIGANRLYAACQRRKQRDWISYYNNLTQLFAGAGE